MSGDLTGLCLYMNMFFDQLHSLKTPKKENFHFEFHCENEKITGAVSRVASPPEHISLWLCAPDQWQVGI